MTPPRRDIQNSLMQDGSGHPTSSGSNQISPTEDMNARMMKGLDLLSEKLRQLENESVELRCYMVEINQYLRDLNERMIIVKSQNNNILQTFQSPDYFPPSAQYNGPVVPSYLHPNQCAFFAHKPYSCYSSVPPSNDISTSTVPFTIITGTPSSGHQQGLVGVPIVEPSPIPSVVIPASATPTAISTMLMKGQQGLVPSIGTSAIEAFPSVPSVTLSESSVPFGVAATAVSGMPLKKQQDPIPEVGISTIKTSSSVTSVGVFPSASYAFVSGMPLQKGPVPAVGISTVKASPFVPAVAVSTPPVATVVSGMPFQTKDEMPTIEKSAVKTSIPSAAVSTSPFTAVSDISMKKQQDSLSAVGIFNINAATFVPTMAASAPPSVVFGMPFQTKDQMPEVEISTVKTSSIPSIAVSSSPFTAVPNIPFKKQQGSVPPVKVPFVKLNPVLVSTSLVKTTANVPPITASSLPSQSTLSACAQSLTTNIPDPSKYDSTEQIVYNVVESVISEDNKTAVPSKSTLTYDTETSSPSSIKAENYASSKPEMTSTFKIGGEFSLNTQKSNLSRTATVSTTAALQKTSSQLAERNDASGAVSDNPKEKADVHFEPIIPLPDKVPIVTGEEDEIVLYENHAKLFRRVKSDWKETGIGNIKILRHQQTGKIRLLMRRDGIQNICLNHYMFTAMKLKQMSKRSYVWCAPDFSKGIVVNETFAVMFKTADIANGFKLAFENAVEEIKKLPSASTSTKVADTSDDDVEFLFETEVSEEDKLKALKLKLPPKFFAYKINGRRCSGCIGCDEEEDEETIVGENDSKQLKTDKMPNDLKDSSKSNSITSASSKDITLTASVEPIDSSAANSVNTTKNNIDGQTSLGGSGDNSFTLFGGKNIATIITTVPSSMTTAAAVSERISSGDATSADSSNDHRNKFATAASPSVFGSGFKSDFSFGSSKDSTTPSSHNFTNSSIPSFGSSSSFSKNNTNDVVANIGINTPSSCVFGSLSTLSSDIGSAGGGKLDKSNASERTDDSSSSNKEPDLLFSSKNLDLSFAALAAKEAVGFQTATSGFSWPGVGAPVFKTSSFSPNVNNTDEKTEQNDESNNANVEEEYDPHYEPIVPLPDIVEVKTGEEDEEIVFRSRAKLYRRDGKEWKERGVGEIKILRDPQNETYRLLMRREQIFKTVLNQRLSDNFTLEKMATSVNAWCWIGMNMPEERNEPVLETLAIRFKNEQLANEFRDEIGSCITAIIKRNK